MVMGDGDGIKAAQPDIVDVFIIILIASAIDIFLFWMATQFIANPVFQKLPDFVSGAYSGVWASIATGTAGIGLVIVKYISQRHKDHINYFLYVSATAIGLFVLIIATSFISLFTDKWKNQALIPPKPAVSFSSFRLDIPSDGTDQIFDQNDNTWGWDYSYKGTISLLDRNIRGTLQPSTFRTSSAFRPLPDQTLRRISADICYWKPINGVWYVEWLPQHSNINNSVEISIPMKAGMSANMPCVDFNINTPSEVDLKEAWLCFKIDFNGGGFIPIPH
jgi:ABC-type multidrug transport system fused ATPase/permease subunit